MADISKGEMPDDNPLDIAEKMIAEKMVFLVTSPTKDPEGAIGLYLNTEQFGIIGVALPGDQAQVMGSLLIQSYHKTRRG